MAAGKNIFVSHIHEDDAKIVDMKYLLAARGFDVKDSSINSTRPNNARDEAYIKGEILAPAIRWASTLVVLISPDTHGSRWVNWEIEYAHSQGKRIVGVWTRGASESDVPPAFTAYHDALVGWNGERIEDAICGKINEAETPSGDTPVALDIPRHGC